jgi:hypothetical protein
MMSVRMRILGIGFMSPAAGLGSGRFRMLRSLVTLLEEMIQDIVGAKNFVE